jgi:cytidylate kinase
VVTVDGPSGSGKGTVSRRLAQTLGWHLLDSGALYRLVAVAARQEAIPLDQARALGQLAARMDVSFGTAASVEQITRAGRHVTAILREESISVAASRVAALPAVRTALLRRQRAFARPPGLVADGRDMGSIVFPNAVLKVFLTASPQERAKRRYKQLKDKGIDVSLPALSDDIAARDRRDAERAVAPLKPAADACVLDSTALTPEEVAERILEWLGALGLGPGAARN